jgi:hypothetical protein
LGDLRLREVRLPRVRARLDLRGRYRLAAVRARVGRVGECGGEEAVGPFFGVAARVGEDEVGFRVADLEPGELRGLHSAQAARQSEARPSRLTSIGASPHRGHSLRSWATPGWTCSHATSRLWPVQWLLCSGTERGRLLLEGVGQNARPTSRGVRPYEAQQGFTEEIHQTEGSKDDMANSKRRLWSHHELGA